jgi:mxaJ protein
MIQSRFSRFGHNMMFNINRSSLVWAVCLATLLTNVNANANPTATAQSDERKLAVCADPSNLPYSNEQEQGFENRIAAVLARELRAQLVYTWSLQRRSFLRRTLNAGVCDVVVGLPQGLQGVLQTRPYYSSSYVFVTRQSRALKLSGMDDPQLRQLKIGLQAVGAEGANTPPAMALARRGIVDHITGFAMWGEEEDASPQQHIIDAVALGDVDVAIVWGPLAGYFAQRQQVALKITPVTADPQQPALVFQYAMALSVRKTDAALRDELQTVLDRVQPEIQNILLEFGVPLRTASTQAASNHALTPGD